MMTSSNGNIFRVSGPLCGEFTGDRWIPRTKASVPLCREFTGDRWISRTKASDAELWCFFDVHLNNRLSKQSLGQWFETPKRSLWRHCIDSGKNCKLCFIYENWIDVWCLCVLHGFSLAMIKTSVLSKHWWVVWCYELWVHSNGSTSQIPQCIGKMPHNAPTCNRNVHIFLLQKGAL